VRSRLSRVVNAQLPPRTPDLLPAVRLHPRPTPHGIGLTIDVPDEAMTLDEAHPLPSGTVRSRAGRGG